MSNLILHPTEVAQWYALVNELEQRRAIQLSEAVESYLVFLLMRFAKRPELVSSVLALDFLHSQQVNGSYQQILLQEVGDKCLLFAGLFPEYSARRALSLSYFIDLGQIAYATLATLESAVNAALFNELGRDFYELTNLLNLLKAVMGEQQDVCLYDESENVVAFNEKKITKDL